MNSQCGWQVSGIVTDMTRKCNHENIDPQLQHTARDHDHPIFTKCLCFEQRDYSGVNFAAMRVTTSWHHGYSLSSVYKKNMWQAIIILTACSFTVQNIPDYSKACKKSLCVQVMLPEKLMCVPWITKLRVAMILTLSDGQGSAGCYNEPQVTAKSGLWQLSVFNTHIMWHCGKYLLQQIL